MRKKHTILLTVIPSEDQRSAIQGKLQFIATGSSYNFTNIEELQQLIHNEIHLIEDAEKTSGGKAYNAEPLEQEF